MKDVLVFHYLPILWYRYPVPNDIREFWYRERPDILNYIYKDLDIQFLPNNIVEELNHQKLTAKLSLIHDSVLVNNNNFKDYIPTEVLSGNNLIQSDTFYSSMNFMNDHS
jgi:hypothetical protein